MEFTTRDFVSDCAHIVVSSKKCHTDLVAAFESMLKNSGGDFASVLISCVSASQDRIISNVLRAVEVLTGAASTLLQSAHSFQFLEYLHSRSGSSHLPAFLELLSNSHNKPHCYSLLPSPVFVTLLDLSISGVALIDLGVAGHASVLVEELVKLSHESLASVVVAARAHSEDATIYLRYLGIMSRVAASSDDAFALSLEAGAIDLINGACRSSDVLVCIVALELLNVLASTRSGLSYLVSSGTFAWLVDLLTASDLVLQQQALREVSLTLSTAAEHHLLDESFFVSLHEAKLIPRFMKCLHDQFEVVGTDTRITGTGKLMSVMLLNE